jgi:hypothetical protein
MLQALPGIRGLPERPRRSEGRQGILTIERMVELGGVNEAERQRSRNQDMKLFTAPAVVRANFSSISK